MRRIDAQATIRITDLLAGAFLGSGRFGRARARVGLTAALTLGSTFSGAAPLFLRAGMIYGPSRCHKKTTNVLM